MKGLYVTMYTACVCTVLRILLATLPMFMCLKQKEGR